MFHMMIFVLQIYAIILYDKLTCHPALDHFDQVKVEDPWPQKIVWWFSLKAALAVVR